MALRVLTGAAVARPAAARGKPATFPLIGRRPADIAGGARTAELRCVRGMFGADTLAAAEERAAKIGIGADRVLIVGGALDEETYARALASSLDMAFEPLDGVPRTQCPVDDEHLIEAAAAGILPLMIDEEIHLVVATRGTAARRLIGLIGDDPQWARRFRFTSSDRFTRFILRCAGKSLAARAAERLKETKPELSAAAPMRLSHRVGLALAGLIMLAAAAMAPSATLLIASAMLGAVFLAWLSLRLTAVYVARPAPKPLPAVSDESLPIYTVMAALYREAASVDGLLRAIERFDYPPEKLDVILAVEADDRETRAAIETRRRRVPVTVIPVPAAGPRTKPKALNVALPFARGAFTVIFDAEDRPEPDQLRRALQAFRTSGDDLACVQARLCIDNIADSLLTRLFAAEYAGHFDVFLEGLAVFRLPLPLGGTSNHFDTAVLREVGGWDPYNVTEDADLGIRLARCGYRTDMIASTTHEEAPAHFGPWLRQRTRWFKGWMQTWLVHMRHPIKLYRDLGPAGFLAVQLVAGGNALSALVHPLCLAGLIYAALQRTLMWHNDDLAASILAALYGINIAIGYLTSAFIGWHGLRRRGQTAVARVLFLTPLHWLLLSLAAWRALYQLLFAPYRWEKTEHGLARTSQRSTKLLRALLQLERHLSDLKRSGELPTLGGDSKSSALPVHAHR
jgi:cellulose synthase/poly-beta-1,6-N-acetylglucosamine synthase-like glycosyltransferase